MSAGVTKIPYELWTCKKTNLDHLSMSRSVAMVHMPKVNRENFYVKTEKHIL